MSTKAGLKAAKAALDAEDYAKTVEESQKVLATDKQNYFARLFLARAQEKQGQSDEAAKTYEDAAKSKPDDTQAWLGLCSVYEAQGSKKVDEYRTAAVKVAELLAAADDKHRCQTTIDKLTSFVKQNGTPAQLKRTLEVLLPGTSIYEYLEGRIPHPAHTYTRIAEITEREEAQRIKQEISERRTRIGARLGQVTRDVRREVWAESKLESLYQHIIDWSSDDEVRRQYEEKLLERADDVLAVLPADAKESKLNQVLDLAEGMVIIKHPFQLAWDLVLETRDLDDLRDLDAGIVREYIALFPSSGLAKVLEAWSSSELSPLPPAPADEDEEGGVKLTKELTSEDRLLLMTEGLAADNESPFAHRLVGDYYLHLEEHEPAVDTARNGLKVLQDMSARLGLTLQNTRDAINSVLATALVHFQSPRHHPEGRGLFEDILARKPKFTPALIGLGLIYEEVENFEDAISLFTRALEQDPGDIRVGTELAWCRALRGDYAEAQRELDDYLPKLKTDDPRARDLRAQVLHRIGVCIWNVDPSKSARRSRDGAYARFLAAIKTNVNFAPAYTSLGFYYADYAKDKKRARQCFQKAFELSPGEIEAAERLAKSFANEGDWDIVEVVAQRVVDSGKARPPPGSKKKGVSWPFSALGVVQMNKQQYQQAIVSFLAALRMSPDDYQSYVGLGESYHNSGRYNSALRTFNHALQPPGGAALKVTGEGWFARYMLANVHRELGDFDEAVQGLDSVLSERPTEFGVLVSLLQTYVEKAWRCLDTGVFGQAVESAQKAIGVALTIAKDRPDAFNMWKGLGDACMIYTAIQSGMNVFPREDVLALLQNVKDESGHMIMADIDQISLESLAPSDASVSTPVYAALAAGILAHKRAVLTSALDVHAQAVAWYNLGWSEHRAYTCNGGKSGKKYLRTAVRCFKRAIELEAGNAEFWNALGTVTTTLNPKVAQHAFVRSLHLNELNAKVWANLGALYLLQQDYQLAHQAFGRAQSTDPEYAHAWIGEGLLALIERGSKEALNHFTHAFEISHFASVITKRQYAAHSFADEMTHQSTSNDLTKLIQPVFALKQLRSQVPSDLPFLQLSALFLERVRDYNAAVDALQELCDSAEADYESNESLTALARFVSAKSDLARNQFAAGDFEAARETAQTALDLTLEANECGLDPESRTKVRLSAHLTAGLASYKLDQSAESVDMFKQALQESDNDQDVICLLFKVLQRNGSEDEKARTREQLIEGMEKHPEHVESDVLFGTMAALTDDSETMDQVKENMSHWKTEDGLSAGDHAAMGSLLTAFAALSDPLEDLRWAQAEILINPDDPRAWSNLADQTGDSYALQMALKTAQKAVPPHGDMSPAQLAAAFGNIRTVADSQRAIFLAPWEAVGWTGLAEALS